MKYCCIRYVVCVGRRPGTNDIHDYLFDINEELRRLQQENSNEDILEVGFDTAINYW